MWGQQGDCGRRWLWVSPPLLRVLYFMCHVHSCWILSTGSKLPATMFLPETLPFPKHRRIHECCKQMSVIYYTRIPSAPQLIVISWLRLYFKQLNCFPSPSTELICCSQLFRLVVCHNLQKRWNKRENQTSELRKSVNRVGHPHSTNCPFKYMNSSYIHIPLSSLKARSILDPEGRLKVHNFSYINNVAGVNIP